MDYIKLLDPGMKPCQHIRRTMVFKEELCFAFEKMMHEKFQTSSIGELTFFLGLQVKQKKDSIFTSKDKYVAEILKKFRFTEVKTASTPMETQKPLLKDEDGEEVDVHIYRSMIGSLMYLTSSRPDIMFAVCQPKLGLWYPKDSPFDLVAYTDSDYAGESLDRKSTTRGKAKKNVRLMMEKLFGIELELMLVILNKAVHKERGDSLVRAATTASNLEAEQDSGNISKTRSKATPNEVGSQGTTSGGGPRRQETIRDIIAQTRFENVSKLSNNLLLTREIQRPRQTSWRLILRKGGEEARKRKEGEMHPNKRRINDIDEDEDITLVSVQDNVDAEMFDVDTLTGEEVVVVEEINKRRDVKPEKSLKKKDQLKLDEEIALKLQAKIDEEEKIARAKEEKIDEANIAWEDIQATVGCDYQLAFLYKDTMCYVNIFHVMPRVSALAGCDSKEESTLQLKEKKRRGTNH
ncbi:uncharacterized mitochondrial protein-like protein [Tanacetum coccineum]